MTSEENQPLSLSILPSGHLCLYNGPESQETLTSSIAAKIQEIFDKNASTGLLRLGITNFEEPLPPTFAFWQNFSKLFITAVCKLAGLNQISAKDLNTLSLADGDIDELLMQAPFMRGGEFSVSQICKMAGVTRSVYYRAIAEPTY